jgi:hypothetical protein
MQLVAYGAQDVYLTGNPKVTFFQAVYKRHTNFAQEMIQQTVNGTAGNDGRVSVTIARNGDLIGDMFLELRAKTGLATRAGDLSVLDTCWVAERAIKDIELSIGGQRIDKHYQLWWRLYSELYLDSDKKANYAKLTSTAATGANDSRQVYLPLLFFFNRNPGLYLPLIALQYHEVRLDFDLSSYFANYLEPTVFNVWGNYVYLDTEERRRFAQKGHEYLIDQVQHTGADAVTSAAVTQVRLSYNHPVKELVWCYSAAQTANAAMWNFTTGAATSNAVVLDSDIRSYATAVANTLLSASTTQATGIPQVIFANNVNGKTGSLAKWFEEGDSTASNVSVGPINTFKLILNGQDRFKEQSGKYFNQVEPFMHHSGTPYPGIYSYSFALKPEEHQPTGTCNFSRIDNAQVQISMDTAPNNTSQWMFAVNYNVLRIQSGMGGLAFSN